MQVIVLGDAKRKDWPFKRVFTEADLVFSLF